MAKFDENILNRNIRMLMKNNHVTQEQLASAIGMGQSNLSKALSDKEKGRLTLEQAVNIADFFHISLDSLLTKQEGSNVPTESTKMTARQIAMLLFSLFTNENASVKVVKVTETIFSPYWNQEENEPDCTEKTTTNPYLAFYLPNYYQIDKNLSEEDYFEEISIARHCGNDTRMIPVNAFLQEAIHNFNLYSEKKIKKETYEKTIEDLLSRVPDK